MIGLDERSLAQALRGCALGHPLHLLDDVDSTNAHALTLARDGAPHGTLVVARQQSAGRGRLGRSWWHDPAHGLALSWLLRPALPARRAPELVHVAALAVDDAVRGCGVVSRIKWPNDAVVVDARGTRKLCGILLESSARGEQLGHAVVGVGLNLNTPAPNFPAELRSVASSILVESGVAHDGTALVVSLCERLEKWLDLHASQGMAGLLPELRARSATLGRDVQVEVEGQPVQGRAVDLDDDGALLVEDAEGNRRRVLQPPGF